MERKGGRCCELFVRLGHQGQGVRMAPVTRGGAGALPEVRDTGQGMAVGS